MSIWNNFIANFESMMIFFIQFKKLPQYYYRNILPLFYRNRISRTKTGLPKSSFSFRFLYHLNQPIVTHVYRSSRRGFRNS